MITKATHILSSTLDDEVVMMSSEKGMYYNLDPIGSRIWELLDAPQTLESLCAQLMEEYDIDQATCQQETEEFLQSLAERGLVHIAA
jgi:PqqD family protein of HPr-rel-A system